MALADILNRIDADATVEAQAVIDTAQAEADRLLAVARTQADESAESAARESARQSTLEAETLLANARLAARDALLVAKRELLDRALTLLVERVVALPDLTYVEFLARAVAEAARGDEAVLVAVTDAKRLSGLPATVDAAAATLGRTLSLSYGEAPAETEHGVVLKGVSDRVDLSIEGIVDARRESLLMQLADIIFDASEAGA